MESIWSRKSGRYRRVVAAAAGLGVAAALVMAASSEGQAQKDNRTNGQAKNTQAEYAPGDTFEPLASSTNCPGEISGRTAQPFVLPTGYGQQVVAEEGDPGTNVNSDNWDMNTQNEFGKDAGRYVFRTHENRGGQASQVSVTDLTTPGTTEVLAERQDWEAFDGIVWTPHGTILAAEEVTTATTRDPDFPQAEAGLVYEFFVDPEDPSELNPDDPRDTVGAQDGIAARPALGSKSHEGMRFDRQGNHYGISESSPGSIFRFVPKKKGDLSEGQLQALDTDNGRTGEGRWVNIPDEQAEVDAQTAANELGANGYNRPEDVETGESTGVDRNNGGNTLYVGVTGTDEVLAVDLSSRTKPFAYQYVGASEANNAPTDGTFDSPDNLALDSEGNLAITEDPGGTPPTKTMGDDVFIAEPRGGKRRPAEEIGRFASLKDCIAEPTGVYFALRGTERFTDGTALEGLVTNESLFVNRQHSGQVSPIDQLVAINPTDGR